LRVLSLFFGKKDTNYWQQNLIAANNSGLYSDPTDAITSATEPYLLDL